MGTMESLNKSQLEKETDKQNLKSELIKREEVKDSPFTIVTTENQSFGTMGKYRITEPYETKEEVKKELEQITWNRIIQVIMLVNETINTEKQ